MHAQDFNPTHLQHPSAPDYQPVHMRLHIASLYTLAERKPYLILPLLFLLLKKFCCKASILDGPQDLTDCDLCFAKAHLNMKIACLSQSNEGKTQKDV